MKHYLPQNIKDNLHRATFRTTLEITLGDNSILRFSTEDLPNAAGKVFLGKLAPPDGLNIELTRTVEQLRTQISNVNKTLGQNLINTPNVLNRAKATVGCFIRVLGEPIEFLDEKMRGFIEVGEITNDFISVIFSAKTSARYNGKTIGSCFPNAEIAVPVAPVAPAPVYNDLISTNPVYSGGGSVMDYDYQNKQYYGRHYIPELQFRSYELLDRSELFL